MIVENERNENIVENMDFENVSNSPNIEVSHENSTIIMELRQRNSQIRDSDTHHQLKADLIEHLWNIYAQEDE